MFNLPRLLYRFDTAFQHADGWRQAGADRFNATPALTWVASDAVRVAVHFESFSRDKFKLDGHPYLLLNSLPNYPLDRRFNPSTDFELARDWQNQVVVHANLTPRFQFRNTFFNRIGRDQYLDAETLGYNATTNILTRGELYFQHNRRPISNRADLLGDFKTGQLRHRFMVGHAFDNQYNYSNRTGSAPGTSNSGLLPIPSVNVLDFVNDGFVDPAPTYTNFPRTRVDHSTSRINGGYRQDQVDVTSRLRVNVAGRFDHYDRNAHNDTWNNDVFVSEGPVTLGTQNKYSDRYGAVYALNDAHWLYAASATQFSPNFQIPADGSSLEPTTARSFEVGHKFETARGRLTASTAFRRVVEKNKVISLGAGLFSQAGQASTRALDFDLEGQAGHGVRTVLSYGYADALYDDFRSGNTNLSGKQQQLGPRHTARVWGTRSFRVGAVERHRRARRPLRWQVLHRFGQHHHAAERFHARWPRQLPGPRLRSGGQPGEPDQQRAVLRLEHQLGESVLSGTAVQRHADAPLPVPLGQRDCLGAAATVAALFADRRPPLAGRGV